MPPPKKPTDPDSDEDLPNSSQAESNGAVSKSVKSSQPSGSGSASIDKHPPGQPIPGIVKNPQHDRPPFPNIGSKQEGKLNPSSRSNTSSLLGGIGAPTSAGMTTLSESYTIGVGLRGIQSLLLDISTKMGFLVEIQQDIQEEVRELRKKVEDLQESTKLILDGSSGPDTIRPHPGTSAPSPGLPIHPMSKSASPVGSVDWSIF